MYVVCQKLHTNSKNKVGKNMVSKNCEKYILSYLLTKSSL